MSTRANPAVSRWVGADYQKRFDALSAAGVDVHGEAKFVAALNPRSVLDAGCGTGRVARELTRRGIAAVGVDADASMIETARSLSPEMDWTVADLTDFDLGRTFDLVLMAGNVPLFTKPGTQAELVAGCARHVDVCGALVAGFQLGSGYSLDEYDDHCRLACLVLESRFSTWDGTEFSRDANYAVSIHRLGSVSIGEWRDQ
jgi:SAM-dependent methyltransferase